MKYLIMTEGTCEKALIDVLIEKGIFSIPVESLLYEEVFHARQLKESIREKIHQLPLQETITIIRIGDKLSDELIIPQDIEERIEGCLKICTKPEFEILHLIYLNEEQSYIKKYKSKKSAYEYLCDVNKEYEKTYEYNYQYFDNLSCDDLREIIKKYSVKRGKVHEKDERLLEMLIN